MLHEAAETEDGEEADGDSVAEVGLHAKAYVYRQGPRTHVVLGSANATDAALLRGDNVELLAELSGPARKVGKPEDLLQPEKQGGLGSLLVALQWGEPPPVLDEQQQAEKTLESARRSLARSDLRLVCQPSEGTWQLRLTPSSEVALGAIDGILAWPITVRPEAAVPADGLMAGEPVPLSVQALGSLTGLIAFELRLGKAKLSFVMNLPVDGMPEGRERAILRTVVNNRAAFLRYLLLLLAGSGELGMPSIAQALVAGRGGVGRRPLEEMPLLEELVRAYARDPRRLSRVSRRVHDLEQTEEGTEILPDGFLELWRIFEQAMEEGGDVRAV